jgi:hypothetical protein
MLPRTIKTTVNIKGGLALARPARGGQKDQTSSLLQTAFSLLQMAY